MRAGMMATACTMAGRALPMEAGRRDASHAPPPDGRHALPDALPADGRGGRDYSICACIIRARRCRLCLQTFNRI